MLHIFPEHNTPIWDAKLHLIFLISKSLDFFLSVPVSRTFHASTMPLPYSRLSITETRMPSVRAVLSCFITNSFYLYFAIHLPLNLPGHRSATVIRAADGRHTHRPTAAVCIADGRRTTTSTSCSSLKKSHNAGLTDVIRCPFRHKHGFRRSCCPTKY